MNSLASCPESPIAEVPDVAQATCPRCQTTFSTKHHNKKFCSPACQVANNRAEIKSKRPGAQPAKPVECPCCEKLYVPDQPWQRWCSLACGSRWRTRLYRKVTGPESVTRACRYCATEYSSTDGRQYYCSDECSRTAKSLREAYRRYGITMQEYRRLWLHQKGVCAICRQPERTERNRLLTIDHDHVTDHVRGLLCSQCNRAIGLLADDPAVILAAAKYVQVGRQLRLAI